MWSNKSRRARPVAPSRQASGRGPAGIVRRTLGAFGTAGRWLGYRLDPTRRRLHELEQKLDDIEIATRRHGALLGQVHRPKQGARQRQGREAVVELLESLLEITESMRRFGAGSQADKGKEKA